MPITARFDQGDGTDLRHVTADGEEIAARLYFAIRDDQWRTAPVTILDRKLRETASGFELHVRGESAWTGPSVSFTLDYRADAEGLTATFEAEAKADFRYNRLGFCVLHPARESAGHAIVARRRDGDVEAFEFPHDIAPQPYVDGLPQPMFGAVSGLRIGLPSRRTLDIAFEGDEFETEDQRNWSDDSFKTYSTPLSLGFPHTGIAGQRFSQTVRFQVEGESPDALAGSPDEIALGGAIGTLPPLRLYEPGDGPGSFHPANGFSDLNRTRPDPLGLAEVDTIALGINGAVHADDPWSILETTATHGQIVAQVRALYPELGVALGPIDFDSAAGEWRDGDGALTDRPTSPPTDPRRAGALGAAYLVGSIASIAGQDPESVGYFDPSIADSPAGRLVAWFADRAGRSVIATAAPHGIAAIAIEVPDAIEGPVGIEVVIANLAGEPRDVHLVGDDPIRLSSDEVVTRTVTS